MKIPQASKESKSDSDRLKGEREKMDILEAVDVSDVQAHEAATHANVTLGGYNMDQCCPLRTRASISYRF